MYRGRYLALLFQVRDFFQSRPATGHCHAISARPDLATPSSLLLIPLVFSSCPKANGGIDLLEIGLSKCSSSRLPRANWT